MLQRLTFSLFLFYLFSFHTDVLADQFHNINAFVGERAAGLGGAFAGISDDPSGAFYNPAGIAFSYDNYVSLSANNYRETTKTYENVFGPGQSYSRNSKTLAPNFFGSIKKLEKFTLALTIVNPVAEKFDQGDQFPLPLSLPQVSNFRVDFSEENQTTYVGPSFAYEVSKRLAIGTTLYYFYDINRTSSTQFVEGKNGSYSHISTEDRRKSIGFVPTLGIQYMLSDTMSLGFSIKRFINTGSERTIRRVESYSNSTNSKDVGFYHDSERGGGQLQSGLVYANPPRTGRVPETNEFRLGFTNFFSKELLIAYDFIYTEGYKKKANQSRYELSRPMAILTDNYDPSLSREATLNYAFGLEYYLFETLAFRFGTFSNFANTKKITWMDSVVHKYLSDAKQNAVILNYENPLLVYVPTEWNSPSRYEYVNNFGYSFSLSWATAKSSITLTYILERGRGSSQILDSQLAQTLKYSGNSVYIVASTHE
jgi:hypothetical protein